ncbi:hypothetical protein BJ165DRAFT_1598918 [Panaeolus papilionaceus]|nr:hypothetical protein BJ165DRAFT_1598918 [Panaeolus papilionaceus]
MSRWCNYQAGLFVANLNENTIHFCGIQRIYLFGQGTLGPTSFEKFDDDDDDEADASAGVTVLAGGVWKLLTCTLHFFLFSIPQLFCNDSVMDSHYYTNNYAPGQGFINPSALQLQPQQHYPQAQSPRNIPAPEVVDAGITAEYIETHPLKGGHVYQLYKPSRRNLSPRDIIEGTWQNNVQQQPDRVVIVPRIAEHTGKPSLPTISFSVNGNPGPYLKDLMQNAVLIDNPEVLVLITESCSHWKQTVVRSDWAGNNPPGVTIGDLGRKTRARLALEVSGMVYDLFIKMSRQNLSGEWFQVPFESVRLLGLSYYKNKWVPIFAVSA